MSEDVLKNVAVFCPDGFQTFFNPKINESYHSNIGPVLEAKHKFVNPCLDILNSKKEVIRVLDPFFGLGYNTGVLLETIKDKNKKIEILAIEKDINILEEIKNLKVENWYENYKKLFSDFYIKKSLESPNLQLTLFIDDIFNVLPKLEKKSFDIIFFDPFSYKVSPEFWSDEFLLSMFNLLTSGGKLTTYSGLKRVEKLAIDNGFSVSKIEALGKRTHSLCIHSFN